MLRIIFLIVFLLFGHWGISNLYSATKVNTEIIAPANSRQEGLQRMQLLVEKFKNDSTALRLTEAQTRQFYLDEFLRCLGWDAGNYYKNELFSQDTLPEARLFLSNTTRFIDYKQRVDDKVFMLEAKRVNVDCDDPKYIFQAKRYCWSSMKSDLVILSNFYQFRVYDARVKPIYQEHSQGEIKAFHLGVDDYVKNFDLLYDTFSKESVERGSLQKMLQENDPNLSRTLPDNELIKQMNSARISLASDIYKHSPNINMNNLNEATQNILNRILFCRILEDRDIEPTRLLELKVAHYFEDELLDGIASTKKPNITSLHQFITQEFVGRMYNRYNGVIFRPHASDKLHVSDNILKDIILQFYSPVSAFDFSTLPVDVIGHVYESYLGKRILIDNGVIKLEETPSVRETGGVFYTPDNIAQFLVERTLNPIVDKKNIDELLNLKIIDPASGSGALLLQSAKVLFAKAREFYAKNPSAIKNQESEFPDAIINSDGSVNLSPFIKAKLVENSIYGIDIDAQANEIAAMWLYMLILENENFSVVDVERKAKIPTRSFKKNASFKLPDLSRNLVCGNALISDVAVDIQAFNWRSNSSKIANIMDVGGFDAVVGNPPYIGYRSMSRLVPQQLQYLRKNYESMSYMQGDMAFAFVEKGTQLLNSKGGLGYILTNSFMFNQAGLPLRKMLSQNGYLKEIINFGNAKVFPEASVYTALLFLSKEPNEHVKYANLLNDKKLDLMFENINIADDNSDFYVTKIPQKNLLEGSYSIPAPRYQEIISIMNCSSTKLKDVADCFSGVITGNNDVSLVKVIRQNNDLSLCKSNINNEEFWLETAILKKYTRPRGFKRYAKVKREMYVIYPYTEKGVYTEEELKNNFPKTYEYLCLYRKRVSTRQINPWFALYGPREYNLVLRPKILTCLDGVSQIDIKGDILFPGGLSCGVSSINENISNYSLLGIINSKSTAFFMNNFSSKLGGKIIYSAGKISELPIPSYNKKTASLYELLDKLVRKVVELKAKDIDSSELEKEVDLLVEEMYKWGATN